jgi:hypothetical protein
VSEQTPEAQPAEPTLLLLDEIEARLLGCLVEKQATTPEIYPLTVNAGVQACNQKTNREPLMNLEPGAVGHALRRLEDKGLVKVTHSPRALRYEHRCEEVYGVTPRQRAVLCVLLLRGPQTLNEIATRTERLATFSGIDEVRDTLERLAERSPAMLVKLARGPGQREERYMHLLCGPLSAQIYATPAAAETSRDDGDLRQRLAELSEEVAQLRAEVEALQAKLAGLQP